VKWISVKDKLPNEEDLCCKHDAVLVAGYYPNSSQALYSIASYYDDHWQFIGEYTTEDGECGVSAQGCGMTNTYPFLQKYITHWAIIDMCPFPESPKE
jgi:Protein of unknown function (DUF551)